MAKPHHSENKMNHNKIGISYDVISYKILVMIISRELYPISNYVINIIMYFILIGIVRIGYLLITN